MIQLRTDRTKKEDLEHIAQQIEEEARMVLPGVQALFGFQLIAVFNNRFGELDRMDQELHFVAIFCTALSVLLVLTPAAYHRQAEADEVSLYFCRLGSRLLSWALLPLTFATALDLFVILRFITDSLPVRLTLALFTAAAFLFAWFVFPQWHRYQKRKWVRDLSRRSPHGSSLA